MATTKIDIDRLAREALSEQKPKPDLLVEGIPFTPAGFYVVVEPVEPRQVSGGEHGGKVILASVTQEAEQYQVTVARVLACGPTAFHGKTTSGIELGHFTDEIRSGADLVGKYVIYQKHTGNALVLRKTGQRVIVLTLSELLGVTNDPEAWRFYA